MGQKSHVTLAGLEGSPHYLACEAPDTHSIKLKILKMCCIVLKSLGMFGTWRVARIASLMFRPRPECFSESPQINEKAARPKLPRIATGFFATD